MRRVVSILDDIIFEALLPLLGMMLALFLLLVVVTSAALAAFYVSTLLAGWLFP